MWLIYDRGFKKCCPSKGVGVNMGGGRARGSGESGAMPSDRPANVDLTKDHFKGDGGR